MSIVTAIAFKVVQAGYAKECVVITEQWWAKTLPVWEAVLDIMFLLSFLTISYTTHNVETFPIHLSLICM